MKLTILTLIATTFLYSGCGKTQTTGPQAVCSFSPAYGECKLTNTLNRPATCTLATRARTWHGFFVVNYQTLFLYENMSMWNYARAFNPMFDPIVEMVATTSECK